MICFRKITILVLFSSITITVNLNAQTDSAYIQTYYRCIVPRALYTFKQQDIFIDSYISENKYNSENFTTGEQHFVGADIGYKWLTLGYSYGVNKENTLKNIDLRFATTYKALNFQANYTSLNNLSYVYYDTAFVEQNTFKPIGNNFFNIGFKVDYIVNFKTYSYTAGFSQGGKQLKSKGSVIASLGCFKNNFSIGSVPAYLDNETNIFNVLKINGINDYLIETGVGYAYNWVIKKHFLISVVEVPCVGFQNLKISSNDDKNKTYFRVPFVNYFKLGVVLHLKRFFTGLSVNNIVRVSEVDNFDYSQVNTSVSLYMGIVFPDTKLKYRKKE
jgi:hypothetical protein